MLTRYFRPFVVMAAGLTIACVAGSAHGFRGPAPRLSLARMASLQRVTVQTPSGLKPMCMARVSMRGTRNSGFQNYDVATGHPAIRAAHDNMVATLRAKVTPPFLVVPMQPDGVQITPTGASDHQAARFKVKGLTGGGLDAVILLPVSAHGPCNAAELAKKQAHTVWVTQNANGYGSASQGQVVVNGADSAGAWVKAVQTHLPLQKGANYVNFDPYPGKTGGAGGFLWGRQAIFEVE